MEEKETGQDYSLVRKVLAILLLLKIALEITEELGKILS
jgi:hypothetical protein